MKLPRIVSPKTECVTSGWNCSPYSWRSTFSHDANGQWSVVPVTSNLREVAAAGAYASEQ